MMKFVIAPDSFKGSLTAKQVAEAMKKGLTRIFPDADYSMVPMAVKELSNHWSMQRTVI